jgi:hypothetical protein
MQAAILPLVLCSPTAITSSIQHNLILDLQEKNGTKIKSTISSEGLSRNKHTFLTHRQLIID